MFIVSEIQSFIIPLIMFALFGIIIFLVNYFSTKQKIIRTLTKLPIKRTTGIRANELTRISGKALHVKEPLIAPFSKRKCVFYTIKIEQLKSSGKTNHWKTIINEEKIQDFFLESAGDYVIIKPVQKPKNYISHLVIDRKTKSGSFNDPTPEFKALLNHYNIKSEGFFGFNKSLRYSEGIIEVGEQITVAGMAKWKTLKEPIEGYSYSKIATLESTDKQKLIITDVPIV